MKDGVVSSFGADVRYDDDESCKLEEHDILYARAQLLLFNRPRRGMAYADDNPQQDFQRPVLYASQLVHLILGQARKSTVPPNRSRE